jgi:Grx4 family monothiol glutaredoxin
MSAHFDITEIGSDHSCTLNKTFLNSFGCVMVLIFYAEHNERSKQFVDAVAKSIPVFGAFDNVRYFSLSAEKCPETFAKFGVADTPTVILTQTDRKELHRATDGDVGALFEFLGTLSEQHRAQYEKDRAVWHPKVRSVIEGCPIIVFTKGTPENPKCGFTRTLLQLLAENGVEYAFYDIIADEQMRYWTRDYSAWPTFPQLFIGGKLVGGLDVTKALIEKGDFANMVPRSCRKGSPAAVHRLHHGEPHRRLLRWVSLRKPTFADRR